MKEKFGKLNHDLIEEERKRPKHEPDDLEDKAIDSQHNTTETHNTVETENVIAALKKKIKSLQIRLKKKTQPKQHNQLDKFTNDSIETNDDYYSTNSNKTELSSYDEKDNDRYEKERNESTTTAHDLIDDDPEPSSFDEEDSYNGLKNDTITTTNGSEYNQEESIVITNNDKEPGVQNDSPIGEENTIKTTQQPSVQVTNELFDEKEKSNKNASKGINELGDKVVEEGNMEEPKNVNSEIEPPSERGLYSLQDTAVDPTEELLDEEGIDDVGKFGRKRNLILKKKKSD